MLNGFVVLIAVVFQYFSVAGVSLNDAVISNSYIASVNNVEHWIIRPSSTENPGSALMQPTPSSSLLCVWRTLLIHGRCGTFYRPKTERSLSASVVALLLLIAGVEQNSGPPVKCGLINARSIVRKGPLIQDIINTRRIQLLAIAETWIVQDDPSAIKLDCLPSGYRVVHSPRSTATVANRGGGLCVIHHESLSVRPIQKDNTVTFRSFEHLLLKLNYSQLNSAEAITIAVVYRPPSSTNLSVFYTELSDLFDSLGDAIDRGTFLCCGDFNCGGDQPTSIAPELLTLLETQGLQQLVSSPTHTSRYSSRLLDLVIVNRQTQPAVNIAVHPSHEVSDHDLVTWELMSKMKPVRQLSTYSFRKLKLVNWTSFERDLRQSALFTKPEKTANSFAVQLDNVVSGILDIHCPLITRRRYLSTHKVTRWLSPSAIESKRIRRRLERRWKSTGTEEDYIAYRKACRSANRDIVKAKGQFYSDRIQAANDSRHRWAAIRDMLHTTEDREVLSSEDCTRLSNGFSQFFIDKIRRMKKGIMQRLNGTTANPLQSDVRHCGPRLDDLLPPTPTEVLRLIKAMPAKSSPADIIPTTVIKSCPALFANLIAHLASMSFSEGIFPDGYKRSIVTPLIKKQGLDRSEFCNYRPISNLNTISKIVERLFLARLIRHTQQSPNFSKFQSAYRRHHSTETALLKMLNDLYGAADAGHRTVLLQLDLSAAFDTVDINTLLCRLHYTFGISGRPLNWIASYLTCRTQTVRVGSIQSSTERCEFGVPQGSVLGPLLFTLYVAPVTQIAASSGVNIAQYADDTQLYIALTNNKAMSILDNCFQAVHSWLDVNGLSLNPDKTEAIVVGTSSRQCTEGRISSIAIGTHRFQTKSAIRSLGVTIDDTLSFRNHVDTICKSTYFHLRALRHIRNSIDFDTAASIASSVVSSRLDYCNSILYGTSGHNLQKLQRVQNSLARTVCKVRRTEHITPILARLHWLPVRYRIHYKIALITFKTITTLQPSYLTDVIQLQEQSRLLRSRGANKLLQRRTRLSLTDRSFANAAPSVWNSLPKTVTSDLTVSLANFKRRLKTVLCSLAYTV